MLTHKIFLDKVCVIDNYHIFTASTSPRNIQFTDEGVKTESGRRRREYLITWQVCVELSGTSKIQFSLFLTYKTMSMLCN